MGALSTAIVDYSESAGDSDVKLFTVRLTEDERSSLEKYRASRGLRSEADAVRHMIAMSGFMASAPLGVLTDAERQQLTRMPKAAPEFRISPASGELISAPYGVDSITGEPLPKPKPLQKGGKK